MGGTKRTVITIKYTPIFIVFELLEKLLSGKENLDRALQICSIRNPTDTFHRFEGWTDRKLGNILAILDSGNSKFKVSNDPYLYKVREFNIHAKYEIDSSQGYGFQGGLLDIGTEDHEFEESDSEKNRMNNEINIPYFAMVKKAYNIYKCLPDFR